MERPYRCPAPEPPEMRGPHRLGEGGRARTPREREPMHTQRTRGEYQKGNRTEPAKRTDRMEWGTSGRGYGTAGRDNPPHAAQGTRGGRGGTEKTQNLAPAPASGTCRKRHAHMNRALHPPRQ